MLDQRVVGDADPYKAEGTNFRQTNAQQGVRGRANHPLTAPPAALSSCTAGVHVLLSAGRKENVGLELWVLNIPRSN